MATATAIAEPIEIDSNKRQVDPSVMEHLPETLEVGSLGEGLKMTSSVVVELDKKFATELLEMDEFSSDRPLNDNHVAHLKQAMERGTFLPEQVNIVTCTLNGKTYRMNGQHTSWARLYMPDDYKCPVRHFKYKADTDNDMRRLYASLDRMKGRTTGNIVIAYLYDTEEWKGYNKRVIIKLAEGLAFHLWQGQDERTMRDADDRAYLLMTDYHDLAKKVGPFLDESFGKDSRHIMRRPVIGAIFATFEKAAQPSLDFWRAVRDGVGFTNKYDARLTLRNALLQTSINSGAGARSDKKAAGGEEMHRWCRNAWNAWRRGEELKILRAVLGTDRSRLV